uniref:Progestin and adipoQ receptor family member 5 n=1 Tax=Junco hyemalis TaxID=40217 RepID=A0A8C5JFX7_JUNHY
MGFTDGPAVLPGSALAYSAYVFPLEWVGSTFHDFYVPVAVLNSVLSTGLSCYSRFLEAERPRLSKAFRTLAFVYPYIFDSIPVFYRLSRSCSEASLPLHSRHSLCALLTFLSFTSHLPERLAPGSFDFIGDRTPLEFPWNFHGILKGFLPQGTATRFSMSAGSWERCSSWKPSPWTWRSGGAASRCPLPWEPSDRWGRGRPPAWPSSGSASAASARSLLPGKNPTKAGIASAFREQSHPRGVRWGIGSPGNIYLGISQGKTALVLSVDGLGNASHPVVIHRESVK